MHSPKEPFTSSTEAIEKKKPTTKQQQGVHFTRVCVHYKYSPLVFYLFGRVPEVVQLDRGRAFTHPGDDRPALTTHAGKKKKSKQPSKGGVM